MERDVVGFELAVGVEQQASQVALQLRLSALERPQEEAPGVIVVCVQVVPDEGRALEDRLHLCQAVYRQFPGDDFTACGGMSDGKGVDMWNPKSLRNRLCHIQIRGRQQETEIKLLSSSLPIPKAPCLFQTTVVTENVIRSKLKQTSK